MFFDHVRVGAGGCEIVCGEEPRVHLPMAAWRTAGLRRSSTWENHTMIDRLDHLVLTVADLDVSCEFYEQVLGMESQVFGGGRRALAFGLQKINLHLKGHEFEPKASHPTPGSADLCFILSISLEDAISKLEQAGVAIEVGPVSRTGARGPIRSVYFRDPDGNLIEVSEYVDSGQRQV